MITITSAPVNDFMIYKTLIKRYNEYSKFYLLQGNNSEEVTVLNLIEYPNSIQFSLRHDLTSFYGNDYELLIKNDDTIIYKEKINII